MIKKERKKGSGGYRAGAGRRKSTRKTTTIAIRVWDKIAPTVKTEMYGFAKREEERVRSFEL